MSTDEEGRDGKVGCRLHLLCNGKMIWELMITAEIEDNSAVHPLASLIHPEYCDKDEARCKAGEIGGKMN